MAILFYKFLKVDKFNETNLENSLLSSRFIKLYNIILYLIFHIVQMFYHIS